MYRLLTALFLCVGLAPAGYSQLPVDFFPNTSGGCSPLVVSFRSSAPAGATYSWDLGNGNTSTSADAQAIYTSVGVYTITLTVTANGSTGSVTHPITVYAPPTANFTASTNLVCGTPVTFTSTAQTTGSGSYLTGFLWDFNDGTTVQYGSSVSHTFPAPGSMSVGLTVTDNHGCTASTTQANIVQVYPALTAAFSSDKQVLCNVTDAVQFTNSSTGPGTLTYSWDFGDGTTSTQPSPGHSYTQKGNYNVKLTTTSSVGCVSTATQPTPLNVANYSTDFTAPPTGVCQNAYLSFTDNSQPTATSRIWYIDGAPAFTYDGWGYTFYTAGTHTIQLANVFGTCPQQVTKSITVNALPQTAPFDVNFTTACGAPVAVNFVDHSPGPNITNWSWQFLYTYNDGPASSYSSTTANTATHTYTANDAYTTNLTVTNAAGCTASVSKTFYINAPSVSIYEPTPTASTSCNQPITKTLAWQPPAAALQSWTWDFGDGNTSTAANPTHTWSNPGQYTVLLHYTDVNGCSGTSVNFISVIISAPFTIDFSGTPTTVCANSLVTFTSPSLTNVPNLISYSFNYGDGASGPNPYHAYSTAGSYTVTLTAQNVGGCTASESKPQYITVLAAPGQYNGHTNTCDGNRNVVTFNYIQAGSTSITWDFGDNTVITTAGNVTQQQHSYARTGNYYINVSSTNGTCGSQNSDHIYVLLKQTPQLSAPSASVCAGGTLNVALAIERDPMASGSGFYYDYTPTFYYGDGTPFTGTVTSPNYGGTYDGNAFHWMLSGFTAGKSGLYVVTTSFGFGCTDISNTMPLTVKGSATAGLGVVADNQCYTNAVILKDMSTIGPNNAIVSWQWNFGDGATQTNTTGGTVSHQYAHPGNYTATLTVQDQGGCVSASGANSTNVAVNGPQANFSYTPSRVLQGNTVYFSNSTPTNGAPNTVYSWDFGDGTTSNSPYPNHQYNTPGTYTVTLTANGNAPNTCTSTITTQILVYPFNSHFQIAARYVTGSTCPPVLAQFTNTSVNYSSVSWDFGDGTTAGNLNYPSHVYTTPGAYQVTLSIYGSGGLIAQYTDSVFVRQPSASLSTPTPAVCVNQPAKWQGKAKGALNFTFDFGDGTVSSGADSGVNHVYTQSGNFTTQLVVTDTVGCPATATPAVAVQVNPLPTVTISPADAHVCLGSSIALSATGGSIYTWTPATGLDNPGSPTPVASPITNTSYSVLVTDDNGCQGQGSINLKVVTPETLSVSPDSTGLCYGDTLAIHAKGTDVYQWIGDTQGLSNIQSNNPLAQPQETVHYTLVGSDSYACFSDTAAVTITVLPLPTVNGGGNHEVLDGTPVTLQATGSADIVQWQWTPAAYLSCTDCAQPVCTPKKPETYLVTVTNDVGCHARDTVQMKLLCIEANVRIPEAFTPNGDGHNDRFTILGIGFVDHLIIYDRWGVKVFERNHFYTADMDGQWDGSFHGQPAPPGVYAWFAEMSCPTGGVFTRKGTVVLIR